MKNNKFLQKKNKIEMILWIRIYRNNNIFKKNFHKHRYFLYEVTYNNNRIIDIILLIIIMGHFNLYSHRIHSEIKKSLFRKKIYFKNNNLFNYKWMLQHQTFLQIYIWAQHIISKGFILVIGRNPSIKIKQTLFRTMIITSI